MFTWHILRIHYWVINLRSRPRPPKNASEAFTEVLRNFKRQALHAVMLRLAHPITGEMMEWYAPLPDDFVELLHALKADYLEHKDELDY